jgi:pimeloyl-ACP methyl ester carboxylesterase
LTEVPTRGFVFDALVAGPDDGVGVVLLHGFPQTSVSWSNIMPTLADAGYRVVAPDQRGYSARARPTDVDAYRRTELVADVLAIADHLGFERFHLVGHDWGAAVAWQVAGRFPERLLTVTSLSVPHPSAFARALIEDDGDQASRSSYIEIFRAEGSEEVMLANDAAVLRMIYQGAGLTEEQAAPYLKVMGSREALGAALNWYRAVELTDAVDLGPITMPTLYIWSTEDPALGREGAEATADYVAGPYQFEVLEGVGHWIPDEAGEETARLLIDHFGSTSP